MAKLEAGRTKTGGRKKGTPNKTTAVLKDAILVAATKAGGKGGLEAYLEKQAKSNPGPFLALLGKVLPLTLEGGEKAIRLETVQRTVVSPRHPDR